MMEQLGPMLGITYARLETPYRLEAPYRIGFIEDDILLRPVVRLTARTADRRGPTSIRYGDGYDV